MDNNKVTNIIKTIKVDTKDEDFPDFNKIDPGFAEVIKNYYKENQVKPSKESYQKVMQIAREHKRTLEIEKRDNKDYSVSWLPLLSYQKASVGLVTIMITVGFLIGIYYFVYNTNSAKNTENLPLISKNENPDPKYRNSNPINNFTMIETAMIVYIEKSDNENDNKLINNIAKKLSENSKKSISMDKDIAYEIILDVKINKNIVTVNIGDAMDNILFTKNYNISNENLEEMANIISTNLLVEFKLK